MEKSSFVKPYSIAYTLDGKKMRWDAVQSHPAVACVLVHRDTKSMLLVRQFRPAVRAKKAWGERQAPVGGQMRIRASICIQGLLRWRVSGPPGV